jgi:signal peptidase I
METDVAARVDSPWRSIWWHPQATIKGLATSTSPPQVLLLAALAGIGGAITYLANVQSLHWFAVLALAVVLGPLTGILRLFIDAALYAWSGRLLGGRAGQAQMRTVLAWSSVPNVIALPVLLGALALFQQRFLRAYVRPDAEPDPLLIAISILLVAALVWSVFIAVRGIGAVQGFGILRSLVNAAMPPLALLALALGVRTFLYQPFSIPAGSMKPTLLIGDYAFANKLVYGWSRYAFPLGGASFSGRILSAEPRRGDVVVFRLPSDPKVDYVKRVVGLPGDSVQMIAGKLHLNGTPVPTEHLDDVSEEECDAPGAPCRSVRYARLRETLPGGASYTILDHEPDGAYDDTAVFTVPAGHYFVAGDNRDNSVDSRGAVGFVPRENLVGRMSVIFFSAGALDDTAGMASAFDNIRWSRLFQTVH